MCERGGGRGAVRWIALSTMVALGACSSEMDPSASPTMSGDTSSPEATIDSLNDLQSVKTAASLMIVGTNGSALVGAPGAAVHFYGNTPGKVSATAAALQIPVCSIELDALVMPPAAVADIANSLASARARCDQEDLTIQLEQLRALQTPAIELIVGNNAAETWHSTNNGVNYFYGDAIVGMLHAARQLNVTVCVVSPNSISVPNFPSGETPGVSISDALAACGLPP